MIQFWNEWVDAELSRVHIHADSLLNEWLFDVEFNTVYIHADTVL